MRMRMFACMLAAVLPARVQAANPFDGVWNVNMNCPTAPDGAFGYSRQFTARVSDGLLRGEYGQAGAGGWLSIEGAIPPTGKATLLAHGLTGRAAYAVGRPQELSPYLFHIDAQFTADHGAGERMEARQCSFQFTKG